MTLVLLVPGPQLPIRLPLPMLWKYYSSTESGAPCPPQYVTTWTVDERGLRQKR